MGLILDSGVLIKAERRGQNARQMLTAISRAAGDPEIAMSVVTLVELAHRAACADTAERKTKRQQFIQNCSPSCRFIRSRFQSLFASAKSTERTRLKGVRLPLADLLIGVTALEVGDSVPV